MFNALLMEIFFSLKIKLFERKETENRNNTFKKKKFSSIKKKNFLFWEGVWLKPRLSRVSKRHKSYVALH